MEKQELYKALEDCLDFIETFKFETHPNGRGYSVSDYWLDIFKSARATLYKYEAENEQDQLR